MEGDAERAQIDPARRSRSRRPRSRITTERPETQIDTVLYVIPVCADDSSAALDCNDGDQDPAGGYASKLVLSNVAAGDYTIVIESGQMAGGAFGVSISTQ